MEVNYRKASCALHLFITHSLECTHGFPYTWMYVVNTSYSFPHSWLIIGFVTRLTRRVPLVEQELLTLPEHLSSPPVFSGVRVTWSLVLCVCFADRCMSFCTFFFWPLCCLFFFDMQILVASLWYLQTLLIEYIKKSLLNCQHLPRGLFAHFHNTIGELYTIFFFFQ
jgi:hypothetical protein